MRHLSKFIDRLSWPLYCRSYLATLGSILAGAAIWIVQRERGQFAGLTLTWQFGVALAALAGVGLVLAALVGAEASIEKWANSWSKHDIALPIMVIALPLYLVLAFVSPRK
jgi:hypothetical protein